MLRNVADDVGIPVIEDAQASYVDPGEMFYHPHDDTIYVRCASGDNVIVAVPNLPSVFNDICVEDKGILDALRCAIQNHLSGNDYQIA
jgi:hypothetical protein